MFQPPPLNITCDMFKADLILTTSFLMYFLFLPIFIFVFYVGYRKYRNNGSGISHADAFTFHMVALEIMGITATGAHCYAAFKDNVFTKNVAMAVINMTMVGQMFFHCLTCGERYLAVVHPITYFRLKQRGGVMIRNVSIAATWLCALGQILGRDGLQTILTSLIFGCVMSLSALAIVSVCSVSILCVLIRPGPGEGGGDRKRMDQSKRSAFNTIVAILGVLLLKFMVMMVNYIVSLFRPSNIDLCVLRMSVFWFGLPSSLVLPLLFLQRELKLLGCRKKTAPR